MNKVLPILFLAISCIFFSSILGCSDSKKTATDSGQNQQSVEQNELQEGVRNAEILTSYNGTIAYVNIDSIIQNYKLYKDLKAKFEISAKQKEDDFARRRKKFEKDAATFQESVQKGLEVRSKLEQMQGELQRAQEQLLALQQSLSTELAEEEAVLMRKILHKVQLYIANFNIKKGYSMILSNVASSSVVLTADPQLNITAEVLTGLNNSYDPETSTDLSKSVDK